MSRTSQRTARAYYDLALITASLVVSFYLAYTHAFEYLFSFADGFGFLGIILVGFFFTSIFTVPPAIVALAQLSTIYPPLAVILLGAAGATLGDYLLFRFVKDRVATDIGYFLQNSTRYQKFMHLLRKRKFRYLALLFAVVLIASPLPDETALTLLGVARSRLSDVLLLTFSANAFGIMLIALAVASV